TGPPAEDVGAVVQGLLELHAEPHGVALNRRLRALGFLPAAFGIDPLSDVHRSGCRLEDGNANRSLDHGCTSRKKIAPRPCDRGAGERHSSLSPSGPAASIASTRSIADRR